MNKVPTSPTILNTLNSRLKDEVGKQECQKVSVNDITKLITKLNRGKSDYYNGTKSHRFCIYVSLLFQCMLTHGHMPEDLARSLIVSLPKDKCKSLSDSGNTCLIVGHMFMGAFSYADDISLLSPSIHGLQSIISICEKFGTFSLTVKREYVWPLVQMN